MKLNSLSDCFQSTQIAVGSEDVRSIHMHIMEDEGESMEERRWDGFVLWRTVIKLSAGGRDRSRLYLSWGLFIEMVRSLSTRSAPDEAKI